MNEFANTIWAVEKSHLDALVARGAFEPSRAAMWVMVGDSRRCAYMIDRGVAVIDLDGVITKNGSYYGSSAADCAACIQAAQSDPEVNAILLRIDSPGGTTPGIDELANAVAASGKPCYAFAEDQATSAAYYVGSQARKLVANRSAAMGGIGVYRVIVDSSAAAEKEGLKVHVVKSGERKGDGVPGTPIPDEMLDEAQKLVDAAHDQFVRAVASGRKMSLTKTKELADGRVYTASEAKTLGLIDEVRAYGEYLDSIAEKHKKPKSKQSGARAMTEEVQTEITQPAPRAATLQELKAELAGADASFLLAQLEASATLPQASKAWIAELTARNEAASKKAAEAEAKAAELEKKTKGATKPGVDPLPTAALDDAAAAGDAIAAWNTLVEAELKAMGGDKKPTGLGQITPRVRAQLAAAKKHPEAHAAYLAAYNGERRKKYGVRHAMRLGPDAMVKAEAVI